SSTIGYKVLPGLEIRSSFGYSDLNRNVTTLYPGATNNPASGLTQSQGSFGVSGESNWQIEPQIEYSQRLGNGKLTALAGSTIQQRTDQDNLIFATNYSGDQIRNYANASSITAIPGYTNYRYAAVFARLNYNWQEKY